MLSQQEMSDRWELQDLCFYYAHLIDTKNFDDLRNVFTEDAHIDYSVYGGDVGNREEIIAYLKKAVADDIFPNSQHLNANVQITVDGDVGHGRVMCFNPMELALPEGGTETFMLGLWYVDEYRRTPEGWRISRRVEEKSWKFNVPDFMGI
ncbi:nuclear transport factor 2 family protein [Parahaliea sp. F7430]|uniref:Nuclear transport factor 2 family protein n=1 Tax=Sediminihaliea albiluteola TaxID=2758564 RepID=A0A7W2TUS1_9GAMM|nr:nuclear transport factor 2 family protein [Sediminihaliea albiluteola]MBA6412347.1 nuclear transport factor 2 family protein [Sediminihaliea albiluteola]